jgi:maltose O-acetyltransferase
LITIGNDCTLTQNVIILAHDASTKKYLGVSKVGTVTIGNKCFIGAGTVVLPGVKIGNGVIVGAGSVVTHDIPDNCLAVGNPAKVVKSAADYIEEHKRKLKNRPVYPSKGWTVGKSVNSENKRIMKEELTSGIGYVE